MRIDERTSVPVVWVASTLSVVVGLVFWVATVYSQGSQNREAISEVKISMEKKDEEVKLELKETNAKLYEIDKKLERILARTDKNARSIDR